MTPEQQLTALARHVREEVQHQSEVKRRLMLGASIRCVCRMLRVDSSRIGAPTDGEGPKLYAEWELCHIAHTRVARERRADMR